MQLWVYMVYVVLVCVCIMMWIRERRMRKMFEGLPCFPLLPFIGNIPQAPVDGEALFKMLNQVTNICEREKSPFVFWFGPHPVIATHDPDDIKTITNNFLEKPYYYNFGRIWLGDGLVTAPGSIWKQSIKKLAGTFTSSVVDGYMDVFNTQATKLVQKLKGEVGKDPFDIIHKYLAYTSLEAICQTALGVQQIGGSLVTTEYYEAFNSCLQLLIERGLNPFLHPDFIYRFTPSYTKMRECVAVLHNVSDTVLQKRKLQRKQPELYKDKRNDYKSDDVKNPRFRSFLDILLEMSDTDPSFTEQQIKSEVDTIIVGGQETVASTFNFLTLILGRKPDIQERLYAEMKSIFGDTTRPVVKEDLAEMRYCEAVIYETLRLYPPVPGFMRYADKDLQLQSCRIPKGTACVMNVWGAGRSEHIWGGDAQLYLPERWMGDNFPANNTGGFLAFSCGRRACIGKRYAMVILKTMLAHCVRELEFISEAEEMEFKIDIALRPTSGNLVKVRLRKNLQQIC